jgi:hypothetical protein
MVPRIKQILPSLGVVVILQAGFLGAMWLHHLGLNHAPSSMQAPSQPMVL